MIAIALVGGGLVALAVLAVFALIATTASPALPPAMPATATAQPGPASTPALPFAQPGPASTPALPFAQPGPASTPALPFAQPTVPPSTLIAAPPLLDVSRPEAGPDAQLQALMARGQDDGAGQANVVYEDSAHPRAQDPACVRSGHWALDVNPRATVAHPYAAELQLLDWARAAQIIALIEQICPVEIEVRWVSHRPAHPFSDRWIAHLPSALAYGIAGPTLRQFAVRHAQLL